MEPDNQKSQITRWKTFLAATLVVFIIGVGLSVPRIRLEYNASFYRSNGSAPHFLYVYRTLRNGDTVDYVQSLLGPGLPNHDPKYRDRCAKVIAANPDQAPSGFEITDLLLGYKAQGNGIHFQFRDGLLINHDTTGSPTLEHVLSR